MKQGTERKPAAERAKAARRAAQLRREAEERAEAQRKQEAGEDLTTNDMLAMLGSALRLPEDTTLAAAYEAGVVDGITVDQLFELQKAGGLMEAYEAAMAAKEAEASAEPEAATSTPKRRKAQEGYTFTAADIIRARDEQGLSWRQVAVNLNLGSPSAARSAYTALTGKHHSESQMTGKRASSRGTVGTVKSNTRKVYAPEWTDESDQDEIIERLQGSRITVTRTIKGTTTEEELLVGRVRKLTWDGKAEHLCVHFVDRETGGTRSVLVQDIQEVR